VNVIPLHAVGGGGPLGPEIPADVLKFAAMPAEERELLLHVHDLLGSIAYGTVVLVLQDGKVIQVETSEKIRLAQLPPQHPPEEGRVEAGDVERPAPVAKTENRLLTRSAPHEGHASTTSTVAPIARRSSKRCSHARQTYS
jgi:hypothetical protein